MSDDISFNGNTPRQVLTTALEEAFPEWLVISSERAPDTLDRPALVIKQRTIDPLPSAPLSHFTVGFFVTVVDDSTDWDQAEDDLDTNVLLVWAALMETKNVNPSKAEKTTFNDNAYLAYDITTDLTVRKG
ncbi:hypothetical protein [Humibacter ginsenosidimutans]|uniref:DUF3168 domain-containing protein n=1 Tax=Humibacter ginsenosidimutans TaxID=2599293 RepID=A0A5B8M2S7_9MICO|nr:hypothetical protein [Humibacter ginsenosidimutans]QDZ14244.1 hypothetical protein FPZ11_05215 [Humibacter ginsenosidimutans]